MDVSPGAAVMCFDACISGITMPKKEFHFEVVEAKGGWGVGGVCAAFQPFDRAITLISPNNPSCGAASAGGINCR